MYISLRRKNILRGEDEMVFLLLFDKHFANYLQIPSKHGKIMFSLCEICLRKIQHAREQMKMVKFSFFITNYWYTFITSEQKFLTLFNLIIRITVAT